MTQSRKIRQSPSLFQEKGSKSITDRYLYTKQILALTLNNNKAQKDVLFYPKYLIG